MIILLHSSKTMKIVPQGKGKLRAPQLLEKAKELDKLLQQLSPAELGKMMHVSPALAQKTHELIESWTAAPGEQSLAIDTFIGDIYSGLQAQTLTPSDREYADETLRILSGLYGIIRPADGIFPYRLEMGYKFLNADFKNLYEFWGEEIAKTLPASGPIVNLSSVEFSDVITRFVDANRVIAPQFLTVNPKTGKPTFVVIHAKIMRGAFAHWMIKSRTEDVQKLVEFSDFGYQFDPELSTPNTPTFVCQEFEGKGLSMK